MDESLRVAIELFNEQQFSEFQDALEGMISHTRAASERQFYVLLDNLAESLLQLSDGDVSEAEEIISAALRKMDEFVPRFREINTEALREDFRRVLLELREVQAGRKFEFAPSKLPRLRVLPG
jgi:uncharacterized protein YecA (UPF0149 family)